MKYAKLIKPIKGIRRCARHQGQSPQSAIHNWMPHVAPVTHLGKRMKTSQSDSSLGDLRDMFKG